MPKRARLSESDLDNMNYQTGQESARRWFDYTFQTGDRIGTDNLHVYCETVAIEMGEVERYHDNEWMI